MRASLFWLKDYVPIDLEPEALAECLTSVGLTVERIERLGEDVVLEIEVTSNRADCLCHLGIAREIAAATGLPLTIPEAKVAAGTSSCADLATVSVEDTKACPRYVARVIEGVRMGPSPDWLVHRLEAVGLRSVNNVVDVTNYVLFETNQPLHAFDLDKLEGGGVWVRRARKGDAIDLLDGTRHELPEGAIGICDASGPVALAGIMGGARSEVSGGTTRVLLESAAFDGPSVRRTARAVGVSTESSARFERGSNLANVEYASRRAAALLAEMCGGSVAAGSVDTASELPPAPAVRLRYWRVEKVLGVRVSKHQARHVLLGLGLESVSESGEGVTVHTPPHRPDLTREIDLIEEIARHIGYDRVPDATQMRVMLPPPSLSERARASARATLAGLGYCEAVTDSFVTRPVREAFPLWPSEGKITVRNPVRVGAPVMRECLAPCLLEVARRNQDAALRPAVAVFEIGRVYLAHRGEELPEEREILAVLDTGGFARVRGALEALAGRFGRADALSVRPEPVPFLAPEAAAGIYLAGPSGGGGSPRVGVLGVASSEAAERFGLKRAPALLELDFAEFTRRGVEVQRFTALPRFPAVRRDVALVVDDSVPWAGIAAAIEAHPEALRVGVELVSVWRGKQIGAGKKSVAVAVTYRAPDRTLTNKEATAAHEALVAHLLGRLSAERRA